MNEQELQKKLIIILSIMTAIVMVLASYYLYVILTMTDNLEDNPYNGPGDNAKLYLQGEPYSEILIEVDFVKDREPRYNSLNLLVDTLDEFCDKEQISYTISDEIDDSDVSSVYESDDILDLEDKYRDHYDDNNVAVVYILYLNGKYEDSETTLGISYKGSSFAIFKDRIESLKIPLSVRRWVSTGDFENSVVVHEGGHLLGLVNINYESERDHEDPINGSEYHCINETCVMYYALEHSRESYIDKLQERESLKPPTTYCSDCRFDLDKLKNDEY